MTDTELLIVQRVAQRVWPAVGAKTKVTHIPSPAKRTRSLPPGTAFTDYFVEIQRFLILPQIHVLMGYSAELDELVIIDERTERLGVRQGLLQIVDALERGVSLHIHPTTSNLRKAHRKT